MDTTPKHDSDRVPYRDPCPCCGARLVGFTKQDYIEHLMENGEIVAARIERDLTVNEFGTAPPTTIEEDP